MGALTATVAGAAREFGQNLRTAATRYESGDVAGRDAIAKVEIPGG
nr:type VII secretion target [Mycolicibacterium baixiangningiae]